MAADRRLRLVPGIAVLVTTGPSSAGLEAYATIFVVTPAGSALRRQTARDAHQAGPGDAASAVRGTLPIFAVHREQKDLPTYALAVGRRRET